MVLLEDLSKGTYVMEYEGILYPRKKRARYEKEYAANDEGCYILDILTKEGWFCIDSTRSLSLGRLLNHAPKTIATLTPFKPLLINGKWRVGFTAARDLIAGEELTWDYGVSPGGINWLKRCAQTKTKCKYTHLDVQV